MVSVVWRQSYIGLHYPHVSTITSSPRLYNVALGVLLGKTGLVHPAVFVKSSERCDYCVSPLDSGEVPAKFKIEACEKGCDSGES